MSSVRFIYTVHAEVRKGERIITKEQIRETVLRPDSMGTGRKERKIALKDFEGRTLKVVHKIENDTCVVITVMWK